jgi:glutaconate CoA-transferase, subunit A
MGELVTGWGEGEKPRLAGFYEDNSMTERQSKKLALAEMIERYVPEQVESLAVGGMHMHNNPMALVREIVRQKKRIKRLITSPAGCINADLLIAAGLVEEVVTSYIGFEHLGLAPGFRRMAQSGKLKVYELDEYSLVAGVKAAVAGQAFAVVPDVLRLSDVTKASADFYKTTLDPFTGKEVLVVPAIKPQISLVLCQNADEYGNAIFKGSAFLDREFIFAADIALMQVEQIITNRQIIKTPLTVTVPGYRVTAVTDAPFSAHPTACHRFYKFDEEHLTEYIKLAATAEGYEQYYAKYLAEGGEAEYLSKTQMNPNRGVGSGQ